MRFFALLLALLFTFQPLFAQRTTYLRTSVPTASRLRISTEEVERQRQEQQARRQWERALQQLAERQNPLNWKEISWQEFLKQNKNAKGVERVSTRLDIKCTENICELLPGPLPEEAVMTAGNGEVDYKTILEGHKMIYVGEGINHNTKAAPLEMAKILRAAREANPNAKILLAAEFLVWEDANNLPETKELLAQLPKAKSNLETYTNALWELDDQTKNDPSKKEQPQVRQHERALLEQAYQLMGWIEQGEAIKASISKTPLLKKAGEQSGLYFSEEYAPVFQAADELGIDQLALDDDTPGFSQPNKVAAKAGEFIVWAKPQDQIPSWDSIKKMKGEYAFKRYPALQQSISVSPWGVRERNREWARRIKMLQPFYDVIIVYAGNGHVDNTYYMDLQPMVEEKDFLNIILYPLEDLPAETQNYYNERFNAAERNRITQKNQIWEERENLNIDSDSLITESNDERYIWRDRSKPFWEWINPNEEMLEQTMQTWDENKRNALEAETEKQNAMFPFNGNNSLKVYLPAQ